MVELGIIAALAVLVAVVPCGVVWWLQGGARRRGGRAAAALPGNGRLPEETDEWSQEDLATATIIQARHQGPFLLAAAVTSGLLGLAGAAALWWLDAGVPFVDPLLALLGVTPTPTTSRAMAVAVVIAALTVVRLVVAFAGRASHGVEADTLTHHGMSREALAATGGARSLGALDHHRLLAPGRSGIAVVAVVAGLAVVAVGVYAAGRPDPFVAAPLLAAGLLFVLDVVAAFAMDSAPCWAAGSEVAPSVEERREDHVLEVLAKQGWTVPAPYGQPLLRGAVSGVGSPATGPLFAGLYLELDVPVRRPTLAAEAGSVHREPWARPFIERLLRHWRPELFVESGAIPLPFSHEAARRLPGNEQATRPLRRCQVLHGPAACGKATIVRWVALHNALLSTAGEGDGEGSARTRCLIIIPSCRGDSLSLRRSVTSEVDAFKDVMEEAGLAEGGPTVGADCGSDIAVMGVSTLGGALAAGDRRLLEVNLVAVLDLDLFEELERAQLRETLRAFQVVLSSAESPLSPTVWLGTSAVPSLGDREWIEAIMPTAADHVELAASDLRAAHAVPVAANLDLVLLPECRTEVGAPTLFAVLDACRQAGIPVSVLQRDAWWPTVRRAPLALDPKRWPMLRPDPTGAHVVIVRDALLPGCRRALSLLNANVEGPYRRGDAVVFVDHAEWELGVIGGAMSGAVPAAFGVSAERGALLPRAAGGTADREAETLGGLLVEVLALATRWPLEPSPHLPVAHERWARLILDQWSPDADAFSAFRADLYDEAITRTDEALGDIASSHGGYSLVEGGLVWSPPRRLAPRQTGAHLPCTETPTLAGDMEVVRVLDADGVEPRYVCDASTYLFQAFPGAVWARTDGVSPLCWRVGRDGAARTRAAWEVFGEDARGAGAGFSLPVRTFDLLEAALGAPLEQSYAGRPTLEFRRGTVRVRVRPRGVAYHHPDGSLVARRLHEDGALAARLPLDPVFATDAVLVTGGAWSLDEAHAFAVGLWGALVALQPALSVLCAAGTARVGDLVPDDDGHGVLIIDGCEGGLGVSRMIADHWNDLGLALSTGAGWASPPAFARPDLAVDPGEPTFRRR